MTESTAAKSLSLLRRAFRGLLIFIVVVVGFEILMGGRGFIRMIANAAVDKARAMVSHDLHSLRYFGQAVAAYGADNPRPWPLVSFASLGYEREKIGAARAGRLVTFGGLTTPIRYLSEPRLDLFARLPYAFWACGDSFVVGAPGPDGVYNLTTPELPPDTPIRHADEFLLARYGYDPTNGTRSGGDLLWIE